MIVRIVFQKTIKKATLARFANLRNCLINTKMTPVHRKKEVGVMAEYECICKYCAFADACPSAYFPANKMKCADLRDMRRSANDTRTPKERGEQ